MVNNDTGLVDDFTPAWLNNTLPGWDGSSVTNINRLERECYQYNRTWTDIDQCLAGDGSIDPINDLTKCDRWVYDTSTFQTTVFTEVNINR